KILRSSSVSEDSHCSSAICRKDTDVFKRIVTVVLPVLSLYISFFVTLRVVGLQVAIILWSLGLEKEPSCLVLTSFSCSSCRCPRRYRYSMCITSVFLMRAFSLNSSRIRGMKPGLSRPARRKCRYRARTCFCSLL
uniref:Uncharacterized protein n=1 Tax=Seriola dumerili TaxID=41447 RepID=A0A3B4UHM7_SERDU